MNLTSVKRALPQEDASSATDKRPKPTETLSENLRAAGGVVWSDPTLKDWSPTDHRIFVGDLGPEVDDALLRDAFADYPSVSNVRVVRDKRSGKSKGFGFVAMRGTEDYRRAMREMNGRYVGSRPVKLRKGQWRDREVASVTELQELRKVGYKVVKKP